MSRVRALLLLALLAGCSAPQPVAPGYLIGGVDSLQHEGPLVAMGTEGTARFAAPLLTAYQAERAMQLVAYADHFYRAPANEGYQAVIDQVESELRAMGFGAAPGLELQVLDELMEAPAWTPRRAALDLEERGAERTLLSFDAEDDRARTMLPVNAPSCDVGGEICLALDDLAPGAILVTREPLEAVYREAEQRGAAAVLSAFLDEYNIDPTGRERQRAAIRFSTLPAGARLPAANVSPDVYGALEHAAKGARVRLHAEVDLAMRPLRTLVATIVGGSHPEEAVALVAHVQEPGAVDNASGVAGLLEGLRALVGAIESGGIALPARSMSCVWGEEMRMSRTYLDGTTRRVVAAFSSDMTGASPVETGAIALLERPPDPGALRPLDPDEHTPWGEQPVSREAIHPSGISIVTRTALVDVGLLAPGWHSREHPYEGGSDHDVFLARGVPAVLLWHFTDFAYHTSLDRLSHVDAEELALTTCALFSAALAIADPVPTDLDRHLRTLSLERRMRLYSARAAGDAEIEEDWEQWFRGARDWLRRLCLDQPLGVDAVGSAPVGEPLR